MPCKKQGTLSPLGRHVVSSVSPTQRSEAGATRGSSDTSKMDQGASGAMTSAVSSTSVQANKPRMVQTTLGQWISSMPGSPRVPSNNSLPTRPTASSSALVPSAQSSPTSAAASTSNAPVSRRFWKRSCEAKYASCMCPTKTACAASHSISSSSFARVTEQKSSWQKMVIQSPPPQSSPRTCFQSSQFLGLVSTDPVENEEVKRGPMARKTPLKGELRSYKMRLYPTPAQKQELKTWFAAARRAYNRAIELMERHDHRPNVIELRKEIVVDEKLQDVWEARVPSSIRARAVQQAVDAVKINRKLVKEKKKTHYRMQFRSLKRSLTEAIVLEKRFVGNRGPVNSISSVDERNAMLHLAPTSVLGQSGGVRVRDKPWLITKIVQDNGLLEDALLKWEKTVKCFYLIVRIDIEGKRDPDLQWNEKRVVSLDPGVRSFQTFYSPDGTHGELLHGAMDYIHQKCDKIDKVQAHIERVKADASISHRQKWRKVSRRWALVRKLHYKIKCFRHNAHYAAANFLLERWDVIAIPEFQSSKMVAKENGRVFGTKTARDMYSWAHYSFRQRLQSKAFFYPGRHVITIGEPGTSKTCGMCGEWNTTLGGSKTFKCSKCHVEMDRDINGARNNLLAMIG